MVAAFHALQPYCEGDEITEEIEYLRQVRDNSAMNSLDRLVQVLFEAQRKSGLKNLTGWFNSVVGLNRGYGLLAQGGDPGEQFAAVANRGNAEADQVFSRELRQYPGINVVLAKRSFVLFEPQTV